MCELNGRFARISNWANKRSNHLFGARFTHHLIADEDYLFTACRYVLLNPVRKTGSDPRRWRWRGAACRCRPRTVPGTVGGLAANDAEHLVALRLHRLLRARFEVQPQERLGVRRSHVE